MKGAIAELCARTISAPSRKSVTSIGTSHHLLLLQKNENNSPTVPKRPAAVRAELTTPMMLLLISLFLRYGSASTNIRSCELAAHSQPACPHSSVDEKYSRLELSHSYSRQLTYNFKEAINLVALP